MWRSLHGRLKQPSGTINAAIQRDSIRRTRMTTRRSGGRAAISHYKVLESLDTPRGQFSLVEVRIETGRTHQIRVHMASIGHPVVGDTVYGAPAIITVPVPAGRRNPAAAPPVPLSLGRNFLHSAKLRFTHPLAHESIGAGGPAFSRTGVVYGRLEVIASVPADTTRTRTAIQ